MSVLSLVLSAGPLPRLYCTYKTTPEYCYLDDVHLPRNEPKYEIISTNPEEITYLVMKEKSKLAVLSSDFCVTFRNLKGITIEEQGLEIIESDALSSCYNLEHLNLGGNLLQVLPEDVFRSNYKLNFVSLLGNRLIGISDNQFVTNTNLRALYLDNNHLAAFPVSAVQNSRELFYLNVQTNDLLDLDVGMLLSYCPALTTVYVDQNIIHCDKLVAIVARLKDHGVNIGPYRAVNRQRFFQMGKVENLNCMIGSCYVP